jgi:hypothetical protein
MRIECNKGGSEKAALRSRAPACCEVWLADNNARTLPKIRERVNHMRR